MDWNKIDNECFIDGICEWSHKCIVCGDDNGCFIECSDNKCIYRMHVLCAWFPGYHMRIEINENKGSIHPYIYCLKHTPNQYDG